MIKINDGLTLASLVCILPDRMMIAVHASCVMCVKSLREKESNFEYMVNATKWDQQPTFEIYDSGPAMVQENGESIKDYTCIGCGDLLREHS